MFQEWMRQINGLVYGWFGATGLRWFQEHPLLLTLAVGLPTAALGGWLLLRLWGGLRRRLAQALLTLRLSRWHAGRAGVRAAAEIRAVAGRIVLLVGDLEPGVQPSPVLELLGPFLREELPRALRRLEVLLAAERNRLKPGLHRKLAEQTARWGEAPDGAEREGLQETISETRHRLAQVEGITHARERLLENLVQAADALRQVESELASLHHVRAQTLPQLREQLAEVAEEFRFEREAHLELQGTR